MPLEDVVKTDWVAGDLAMVERVKGGGMYLVFLLRPNDRYGRMRGTGAARSWFAGAFPEPDTEYTIPVERMHPYPVELMDDITYARLFALRMKYGIYGGNDGQ